LSYTDWFGKWVEIRDLQCMPQHAQPHESKQRGTSTNARERIAVSVGIEPLTAEEILRSLKLLNVPEAAAVLAVSKRTLQQLTADRLIAAVRFGRNVRYSLEALQRFVESRTVREIGWKGTRP
jgi:excisionase family DNA binding protein